MIRTPLRLLIALAALLSCPLQAGEEKAKAGPGLALNLATFNIRFPSEDDGPNRWEHRRELLFQTVRDMDPDVMGVQEAFASQLREISEAVEGYAYVGAGRDDGKEDGEHASIFYKTTRFEPRESGTFWLSDTPEVVASNTWEAACNRVCTWIVLEDRITSRKVAVYNAHYDHKSAKAKARSPIVIVEQMVKRGHDELPLVLMGDFNSGPDSPQMRYLIDGKATVDGEERTSPLRFENTLAAEESLKFSTYSGWEGRLEGRQIDYVLVAENVPHRLTASAIRRVHDQGRYPSDHYPVTASVIFP